MHRLIFIGFLMMAIPAYSQKSITWDDLKDVKFTDRYSEEVEAYYYYPHFGTSVRALEGQEIVIKGYILVVDKKEGVYVLSRSPMAACFFCGAGGPESVMELKLKPDHSKYKMDQVATFKGTFKLNQDDIYHCNYILEEAEED